MFTERSEENHLAGSIAHILCPYCHHGSGFFSGKARKLRNAGPKQSYRSRNIQGEIHVRNCRVLFS